MSAGGARHANHFRSCMRSRRVADARDGRQNLATQANCSNRHVSQAPTSLLERRAFSRQGQPIDIGCLAVDTNNTPAASPALRARRDIDLCGRRNRRNHSPPGAWSRAHVRRIRRNEWVNHDGIADRGQCRRMHKANLVFKLHWHQARFQPCPQFCTLISVSASITPITATSVLDPLAHSRDL